MGYRAPNIEAQIILVEYEFIHELTMLGFKDVWNFF